MPLRSSGRMPVPQEKTIASPFSRLIASIAWSSEGPDPTTKAGRFFSSRGRSSSSLNAFLSRFVPQLRSMTHSSSTKPIEIGSSGSFSRNSS